MAHKNTVGMFATMRLRCYGSRDGTIKLLGGMQEVEKFGGSEQKRLVGDRGTRSGVGTRKRCKWLGEEDSLPGMAYEVCSSQQVKVMRLRLAGAVMPSARLICLSFVGQDKPQGKVSWFSRPCEKHTPCLEQRSPTPPFPPCSRPMDHPGTGMGVGWGGRSMAAMAALLQAPPPVQMRANQTSTGFWLLTA